MDYQVRLGNSDERSWIVSEGIDEIVADFNWSRLVKNEAWLPCKVNKGVPGCFVVLDQICCGVEVSGMGNVAQLGYGSGDGQFVFFSSPQILA